MHALITLTPAGTRFIKLDEQEVDIDASKLASGDRLKSSQARVSRQMV
ncbi:MAG: hypothetical protein IPL73_19865 [Candidatus Obscuribacter sp.]|nr:hypothetical protein [Candidatus Obscuribacter sp.]